MLHYEPMTKTVDSLDPTLTPPNDLCRGFVLSKQKCRNHGKLTTRGHTMEPESGIDGDTLDDFLHTASQRMQGDQRSNFRVICLTTDLSWDDLLLRFEGRFEITTQGDLHELHGTYEKHDQVYHVYLYLYRHPETQSPVFLTLNSHEDFRRTADRTISRTQRIHYIWFPPEDLAFIQDEILDNEGAKLVAFEGEKYGRQRKYEEERRPEIRRKSEYEGDDAAETLEERKMEYGITPIHLYFEWPTKGKFHFRDEGEFVLTSGNPDFFFKEIVTPTLETVNPLNTAIKASELHIVERHGIEHIEKESLEIKLKAPLGYEERGDLLEQMKEEGFFPYSVQTDQGSLLLNGRIVDEANGGMISLSTDGQIMSVLPRYDSGFDSLLRFYRFVVEEVDSEAYIPSVSG